MTVIKTQSFAIVWKKGKEAEVVEKKFVPCDGNASVVTYSNASNFAVFSHFANHPMMYQKRTKHRKRLRKESNAAYQ